MKIDELKKKLTGAEDEGADRAKIYDEVLSEVSAYVEESTNELATVNARVDELTKQVGSLTDTNLKLLDKVKYIGEGGKDGDQDDDDVSTITIEDLFKED